MGAQTTKENLDKLQLPKITCVCCQSQLTVPGVDSLDTTLGETEFALTERNAVEADNNYELVKNPEHEGCTGV